MNESLLGCFVCAFFIALFAGADSILRALFPGAGTWTPLAAFCLVSFGWLAVMFCAATLANRRRK